MAIRAGGTTEGTDEVVSDIIEQARRRPPPLDDVNRRIIELLGVDGRLTNRALADQTGLTETTIAARIRSLTDRNLLGITAVVDWQAAGYNWDFWLCVESADRTLAEVGADLAKVDGVHSVQIVFGPVDFVVHALSAGSSQGVEEVVGQLKAVAGVERISTCISLETLHYSAQYARIPVRAKAISLPQPAVELDDLDHKLISAFVSDGRQSNREVGRKLKVSEGTVRLRLRRFEEAGLLRIVGQSDPYLTGQVNAWAYTWVDTRRGAARAVAEQLAALPEAFVVALVAGPHELLVGLFAASRLRLIEVIGNVVRTVPGVASTQTWEVVQTIRFDYQWGRLL